MYIGGVFMKFNKKYIVSVVVLIGAIVVSILGTYNIKSNADEETLADVKAELQQQIDSKSKELEEKDKQIEELNSKVSGQEETITQLNNNIATLSNAVSDTQQDLTSAKATQKADKAEVVNHADEGDSNLQQQIDTINSNCGENREIPEPSDVHIEPVKEHKNEDGTR